MTEERKYTEAERKAAVEGPVEMTEKPENPETLADEVREWTETPSENPAFDGATPGDLARALLGKPPVCHTEKVEADEPSVNL